MYSVSLVQRTPAQTVAPAFVELGPIISEGLTWGEELNREGSASVTCNPKTLDSAVLNAFTDLFANDDSVPGLELWIHRDSVKVHRGPVIGMSVSGTGEQWSIRSVGPLYYLRYMYVVAATNHTNVDQYTIAAGLINQWQSLDWGNYGLDTSAVGTSGITRSTIYDIGVPVFENLSELAESDDGFDVWVDYDDLDVHFGVKGTDKTDSVVLDRRGITDVGLGLSVAAGDLASQGLAISTASENPPDPVVAENTTLRNSFGRSGAVGSFSGITDATSLADHAFELQALRTRPLVAPSPRIIPVAGAGVEDFSVGDTVQFNPQIGVPVVLERRIQRTQVTVSDTGNEEIGVSLV